MNDKTALEYVRWLKHVLKLRGWTPSGWAKRAGMPNTTITRPINGERGIPQLPTLMRLADVAGVPPPLSLIGARSEARGKTIVRLPATLSGREVLQMLLGEGGRGASQDSDSRLIEVSGQRNAEHVRQGDVAELILLTEDIPRPGQLIAVWCESALHVGRLVDGQVLVDEGPPLQGKMTFIGRVISITRRFE